MKTKLEIVKQQAHLALTRFMIFLDIQTFENYLFEARPGQVEVRSLINTTMQMVSIEATQRNQKIQIDMPQRELTVVADQQRIREVVIILVENAINFSQNTPIEVFVWIDNKRNEASSESTDSYLHVKVEDHGTGIPASDLRKIFTYNFRSSTTHLPNTTTGIGKSLWLAKQIAINLGGDVHAESALGFGSAFTCTFQVETDPVKAPKPKHSFSGPFSQSVSGISPNNNDISSAMMYMCQALDLSQRKPNLGIDQSRFGFRIQESIC